MTQSTPDPSQSFEELDEGYDFEEFREAYRKHHKGQEASTAFIVELVAMQAGVLAAITQAVKLLIKDAKPVLIHEEYPVTKDFGVGWDSASNRYEAALLKALGASDE
jgi:hypothetical protein